MQTIPKVAKRTLVTITAGFMWFTASANADVSLSFNTLPSNQGWTYESAIGTKEQDVFSVNGAAVHQNSLRIFDAPNYRMNGVVQRATFDLQFRARATAFDVPNNPLGFTVLVGAGDFLVYFGMAQGFVELEENVISTVDVAVDTSQFHDYRIIGDPGAGSYRFFIDGTQRLSRGIGNTTGFSSFLQFGDRLLGASGVPVGAVADLSFFSFQQIPRIILKPSITLWPPNHKYVKVTTDEMVAGVGSSSDSISVSDVVIESATSDEPDDVSGDSDGSTLNDILIANGCKSVDLRAERDESKNGRVYSIALRVKDTSGSVGRAVFKVTVPIGRNGVLAIEDAPAFIITSLCP